VRWVASEAPGQGPANVRLAYPSTHRPGARPHRMHRRTPACVERSMASDPDRRSVVPPERGTTARTGESALPQPTESRYLRTAQVAELLHVSPKTVSRWAQEGRLPFFVPWAATDATPTPRSGPCWKPCPSYPQSANSPPRLTARHTVVRGSVAVRDPPLDRSRVGPRHGRLPPCERQSG
jgi:hypothetical protein